jgi:hypothetical protein
MKENRVQKRKVGRRLRWAAVATLLGLIWAAPEARAGDLANIVKDLYDGDGILLADPPPGSPFPTHEPHFLASSLQGLDNLNQAIAANVGFFSFNSSVVGYRLDVETGEPIRITESLGPILSERATTLGHKKLDITFTYTRVEHTQFEGEDLDDLFLILEHEDVNGDGIKGPLGNPLEFELDEIRVDLDLKIRQDIYAFIFTYGLLEEVDVGIVIPFVTTEATATAFASLVDNSPNFPNPHVFDPTKDPPADKTGGTKSGIGDVILRGKWNFLRDDEKWPDAAVLAQFTFPSGDDDNLLGTGELFFQVLGVVSKTYGRFTPHLTLGHEVSSDHELNNVRYGAGTEISFGEKLTAAVDFLGRWEYDGDGIGDDRVDIGLGARWSFGPNAYLVGAVLFPINDDDGLQADVIWTLGVELTF